MTNPTRTYRRLRIGARIVLALGVLVSLAANVLHANPNPISQAVAAWAPVALFLAVELISRVPAQRRGRSIIRIAATSVVAGIAAWVSYWHMVGVAIAYGETGITPYLLPISVDGLIVIASITLVEVNQRLRELDTPPPAMPQPVPTAQQPPPAKKATPRKRTPAKKTTPRKAPAKKATTATPTTPAPAPAEPTTPVKAPALTIPTDTINRLTAGNRNGNTTPQESLF